MKTLPRPVILHEVNGKLKPVLHHPYTGNRRINRYFDMISDDFRLLNKPFTPIVKWHFQKQHHSQIKNTHLSI
jgi:hypothetical protein